MEIPPWKTPTRENPAHQTPPPGESPLRKFQQNSHLE